MKTKAQMKIQQMAFMIVGVIFFFILVGMFFIWWQYGDIKSSYELGKEEQAISSLGIIADMGELNCGNGRSFCVDEDKLVVMSNIDYGGVWPVESVEVYKIYPSFSEKIVCVGVSSEGCNYYPVYDSGQQSVKKYSTFVSICKKLKENGVVYEKCEIGKLLVGMEVVENGV